MRPLRTPTAPTADAARKTKHTDAADGRRSNAPPIRPCPLSLDAVAWALCQHPNPASGPVLGVLRRAFRVFVLVPRFLDWSKVRTSMRSLRRMSVLRPKEGDFGGSRGELQTRSVVGNKRMPAGGLACRTFKFLSKKEKKQVQAQVRGEKDSACRNPEDNGGRGGKRNQPHLTRPMGPRRGALPPPAVDFRKRQVTCSSWILVCGRRHLSPRPLDPFWLTRPKEEIYSTRNQNQM